MASKTRRRTSSPKPSRSAALAVPVLTRKLQCFSETLAPPRPSPRHPARSISSQALTPGGFLKVLPPVGVRTGWVVRRVPWISAMRPVMASLSPDRPVNRASTKIHSAGTRERR